VVLLGSADQVATRFQSAMAQLGMQAQVTADNEGIKIAAVSRSGKQLAVALKNDTTNGNPSTRVQMDWRGGSDSELESQLMLMVNGVRR
jgi:hypothetical protein